MNSSLAPPAYRDTDRFVTARTGLIPLSVSADRLAHPAMRCADIQAKIARDHGPQPRDGSGRLAEVYPAASLKSWGLLALGYKGPGGAQTQRLAGILEALKQAAPCPPAGWPGSGGRASPAETGRQGVWIPAFRGSLRHQIPLP